MNDTKLDDTNKELRDEIHRLKKERQDFCDQKAEAQMRLTKIRNLIRSGGRMTAFKYKETCDSQSKQVAKIQQIDKRLGSLKLEIQKLCDQEHYSGVLPVPRPLAVAVDSDAHGLFRKEHIESLVALREKYQQFSADHTRVASMRTMAAEFANALNPIIRAAVNPPRI